MRLADPGTLPVLRGVFAVVLSHLATMIRIVVVVVVPTDHRTGWWGMTIPIWVSTIAQWGHRKLHLHVANPLYKTHCPYPLSTVGGSAVRDSASPL